MRYPKQHKAITRRRIVGTAAAQLRAKGIQGIGVADLMRHAGLTHGSFYAHFPSRDALVAEAMTHALREEGDRLATIEAQEGLDGIIDQYLSLDHIRHPEVGCPLAHLGGELARAPGVAQKLRLDLERLHALLARHVTDDASAELLLATLVGAAQLGRLQPKSKQAAYLDRARVRVRALVASAAPQVLKPMLTHASDQDESEEV